MPEKRQKTPLLLKLKRIKNSKLSESFNNIFSFIKPVKKYRGKLNKILLIRNDRIGDAVVTLPVIRDLKLNYTGIKIDVLVSRNNKFVFEDFNYIDEVIEFNWLPERLSNLYKLPIVGSVFQFIRYVIYDYFFDSLFRQKIEYIKAKKYDTAIDLVGLKKNILLSKMVSRFSVGPKKFGLYFLYDYYLDSNWVSAKDRDFMTKKIEKVVTESLNLTLIKRNNEFPLIGVRPVYNFVEKYELIFHIGTSDLRKLSFEKEKKIIEYFKEKKILIIDSEETNRYLELKKIFSEVNNIKFKVFNSLSDISENCIGSKLMLSYDGGQTHYLSQFIRTVSIFGPGSIELWKPYEFFDYTLYCEDLTGCRAIKSEGEFGHVVIYYPVWCRPCFDVGCKEKPCLGKIKPEFIKEVIEKKCLQND